MRLERLLEEPVPSTIPLPLPARVEAAGGVVQITYLPTPSDAAEMPVEELLNRYLATWNVERDGEPAALNADVIHALDPVVRDAFREAILARPKAKDADKPDKPPEKPAEPAHGSFEPVGEKPATSKEKP